MLADAGLSAQTRPAHVAPVDVIEFQSVVVDELGERRWPSEDVRQLPHLFNENVAALSYRATDVVLRLVAELGGSISAEHGIGVAKTRWLHLTRTPADIETMRAIKAAFDPANLLNPGVIFG